MPLTLEGRKAGVSDLAISDLPLTPMKAPNLSTDNDCRKLAAFPILNRQLAQTTIVGN